MKLEHATKSGHMMLAMNKYSCVYLALALLATGEGWEFVSFIQRHPSVVWQLATFSIASALGQVSQHWNCLNCSPNKYILVLHLYVRV